MPDETGSVAPHPFVAALESVTATTRSAMSRMRDELSTFRAELEAMRTEQRSAPVPVTQPIIDTDALVTRVAALVPIPKDGSPGADGRDGQDGKGAAELNVEEIIAQVAERAIPKILAAIPTPKDGKDGERGDDGLTSIEEIRAAVREEVLVNQRTFYKGVYSVDEQYRTSDAVTWDGSLWFAQRDTTAKPGTDDNWKLAVKKGRDGKDAKR